jgi:acyl-coenzyme A thioesterase PaaI-like protein
VTLAGTVPAVGSAMGADGTTIDPAEEAARIRAGRAVRDLGHALVGRHADAAVLHSLAVALEGWTASLDAGSERYRDSWTFDSWYPAPADGEAFSTFAERPVSGAASPWGFDVQSAREGDEAVVGFTLRSAHEGAPGRSHGGLVAAIFDDVMGFIIQLTGVAAFTGELTVRYERGVPLHVPLVMRARLTNRLGRKLHISADLWDGDQRVARATSTYITIDGGSVPRPESPRPAPGAQESAGTVGS